MNIKIISAGAGSGKTYRLTSEMVKLLAAGVRPSGIIATTFTQKAAAELQERVRLKLLQEGLKEEADELTNALIGTVHSLGVKLLRRFAYEAGVSPSVDIMAEEDQQLMFNKSLAMVLTQERVERMELLANRLGLNKMNGYDWRSQVKDITDIARGNDFSTEVLKRSRDLSFRDFERFLASPSSRTQEELNEELDRLLDQTLRAIQDNDDDTKKTRKQLDIIQAARADLRKRGHLLWYQ
ncbi:MAG: UvrD-helicase domain-containing protein, partial [Saprospiraceae bacterium]|nr:UvrD-helicase domain-containing protein [Saprospiraceae bacterium]